MRFDIYFLSMRTPPVEVYESSSDLSEVEVKSSENDYFDIIKNYRQVTVRKARRRIMKDRRKEQKRILIEEAI